jgi:hypothetical protein
VVLGTADYDGITRNQPTQAVQQAVSTLKTLLLVGYGGGLDDPNFKALRTWMREAFGSSRHRHYRLCLDEELAELQSQHQDEPIVPIAYGATHDQLALFLNGLGDDSGNRAWFPSPSASGGGCSSRWPRGCGGRSGPGAGPCPCGPSSPWWWPW